MSISSSPSLPSSCPPSLLPSLTLSLPWPLQLQVVPQLPQGSLSAPPSPAPASSSSSPVHEQTLLPLTTGSPGPSPPLQEWKEGGKRWREGRREGGGGEKRDGERGEERGGERGEERGERREGRRERGEEREGQGGTRRDEIERGRRRRSEVERGDVDREEEMG